ncbi:MAG: FAD-dependent monooxygenase, partial [Gammaproteobacteria bacterium]|nr:FAD-dependent monooxygenase [Gammaproteobacteria bacterium]
MTAALRTVPGRVLIVGGGLAGSLLAILLARRGLAPCVIERSSEEESRTPSGGRSINLALAARGIAALERAGVRADVDPLLIPMRGRSVHEPGEVPRFLPYGQRRGEEIYSVPRATLNGLLQRLARERFGVEYRYRHTCVGVDADAASVIVKSPAGRETLGADAIFAADGAGSVVRRSIAATGAIDAREELLDHGYVELTIPARGGDFALRPDALHIWPRGGFMLIALPNPDRSFTATLFLPLNGEPSFEALRESGLRDFFAAEFADALPLIPELGDDARQRERTLGTLGTVYCSPWSFRGRILLIGDAAHAIVPFHGQGMNAAFEDCAVLDALLASHDPRWPGVFDAFERRRADDAAAIAVMAIENYREMRDSV